MHDCWPGVALEEDSSSFFSFCVRFISRLFFSSKKRKEKAQEETKGRERRYSLAQFEVGRSNGIFKSLLRSVAVVSTIGRYFFHHLFGGRYNVNPFARPFASIVRVTKLSIYCIVFIRTCVNPRILFFCRYTYKHKNHCGRFKQVGAIVIAFTECMHELVVPNTTKENCERTGSGPSFALAALKIKQQCPWETT